MNALEIVDAVREYGASLAIQDGELVVRGTGQRLPEDLRAEVVEHKAELLIALGCPFDSTVAGIVADIRPHLSPALQRLPDSKLLALINWHIISAWEQAIQKLAPATSRRRR